MKKLKVFAVFSLIGVVGSLGYAKSFEAEPMTKQPASTDTDLFRKEPVPPASPIELPEAKHLEKTNTAPAPKKNKKKSKKTAQPKPTPTATLNPEADKVVP